MAITIKTDRISFISLYTFSAILVGLFFLLDLNLISKYVNLLFALAVFLIISHPEWFIFYYTFVLDRDRIIQITGFLDKQRTIIPVTAIAYVTLRQSFLGRILNYGDVHVAAFGETKLQFRGIRKPQKLVNKLEAMMEKYRTAAEEKNSKQKE